MDLALVEKLAPNAKFVKADYNASVKNKQLSRLPKDTPPSVPIMVETLPPW
jgi:hypothetical protein